MQLKSHHMGIIFIALFHPKIWFLFKWVQVFEIWWTKWSIISYLKNLPFNWLYVYLFYFTSTLVLVFGFCSGIQVWRFVDIQTLYGPLLLAHHKVCDEITYPFPNLQWYNWWIISPYTFLGIWLLIYAGIKFCVSMRGPMGLLIT